MKFVRTNDPIVNEKRASDFFIHFELKTYRTLCWSLITYEICTVTPAIMAIKAEWEKLQKKNWGTVL